MIAAFQHNYSVVELLINLGADINARNKFGVSALAASVRRYSKKLFGFYISEGTVNDKVPNLLIEKGAVIEDAIPLETIFSIDLLSKIPKELLSRSTETLHNAIEFALDEEVMYLIDSLENVDLKDKNGCSPLSKAKEFGRLNVFDYLKTKGARLESANTIDN